MTLGSVVPLGLAFGGSYALGAIPFGLLLARAFGVGDLRRAGSGNIGATNAMRVGGPWLGGATLLLDAAKGACAVLGARALFGPDAALAAGAGAFLGHLYSVWLGFRGGKGVATMLGIAVAVLPLAGAVFAAVWLAAVAATRTSSVGGLAGAASAPVAAAASVASGPLALFAAMGALVWVKHRANLVRLLAGTEPRIGR